MTTTGVDRTSRETTSDDSGGGDSAGGNSSTTTTPTRGSGSGGDTSAGSSETPRQTTTSVDRTSRSTAATAGTTDVIAEGDPSQIAEQTVSTNLESGIEREGVGPAQLQSQAEAAEQQFIQENEGARTVDDVAVRFDREKGELVTTYSRSRSLDLVESEIEEATDPDKVVNRDPKRMFAGTERVPVGVNVDRSDLDVQLVETEDGGQAVRTSFNEQTQREIAKQKAASSSVEFGPDDFEVEDTEDGVVARPTSAATEEKLRKEFAEQHGTDPDDVEIVREDGEIVGARGEVKTEGQQRESQLLPSVDVDFSERAIEFESGDLSALPEPTPSRVFGELAGFDEERISSMEERAGEIGAKTQGGTPVGVGGGRTLPLKGIAAGVGAVGVGAAASQQTGQSQSADTSTTTTSEVGLGSGISETEVGLGRFTSTSEIEVAESTTAVDELEPTGAGPTATTVEPSEGVASSEVGLPGVEDGQGAVGGGATGTQDGTVVPGDYPLPGRDLPRNPAMDRSPKSNPEDFIETGAKAAPVSQQISPEEVVVDEEVRRHRRSRNRELEEILSGPSEDVIIGEPDVGFPSERQFPTGASAVVSSGVSRVEAAESSNVLTEADSVNQSSIEAPAQGSINALAAGIDTDTANMVDVDVGLGQQTALQTATGVDLAMPQAMEAAPGMANEFVTETPTANEVVNPGLGVASGVTKPTLDPESKSRGAGRQSRFDFFERDIIAPVEEDPLGSIDGSLTDL